MKRIAPLAVWIFCGLMCGQVNASTDGTANPLVGGNVTVDQDSSDADNDKVSLTQNEELASGQGQAAAPVVVPQPTFVSITVGKGDSLWALAEKYLGDGSRYPELVEANKAKYPSIAKNPDLIFDGWELTVVIPPVPAAATTADTAAATPTTSVATTTASPGQQPATTPPVTIPEWTTEQKMVRLQKAIDDMNVVLARQGKMVTSLTAETVRMMIDSNFLTDLEWMALNPPEGQIWTVEKGKLKLVNRDGKPITNETAGKDDATKADAAASAAESAKADEAKKAEEAKTAEDAKKAEEANKQGEASGKALFATDLKNMGMANLLGKNPEYQAALERGMRLVPNTLFKDSPFVTFAGYKNLVAMQVELAAAHMSYEKNVRQKDTTNRWWNPFDDDIKSSAERVRQARERLSRAFAEFKTAYQQAKAKADAAAADIKTFNDDIKGFQAQLNKIDQFNPENGKEVQRLLANIKLAEARIKDRQEQVDAFEPLKKLFNM